MKIFKVKGNVAAVLVFVAIILASLVMSYCSAPKTCAYMHHYNKDVRLGMAR